MELPAYGLFCDLICGAAELGLNCQGLLEGVGWSAGANGAFDAWLPEEQIDALWALLIERTQDAWVALKLGEQARRTHLINALMSSSGCVYTALESMAAHWHLLYPESEWRLEQRPNNLQLGFLNRRRSSGADLDAQYRMAWLVAMVRRLTQGRTQPRWVAFRGAVPAELHEFYRVFQCPVAFGQEVDAVTYANLDGQPMLSQGDPWLQGALLRIVTRNSNDAPLAPELPEVLRTVLRVQLEAGDAGIKTVAPRMRLTVSQLRRQLREHDLTYREIMESVRKQVCLELTDGTQLTIEQIGRRLGYSNTANFYRACRRWFGMTPTDLRRLGEAASMH